MTVAIIFCIALVAIVAFVPIFERFMVYRPDKKQYQTPQDKGLAYRDISVTTEDGITLNAWAIMPEGDRYTTRP